MTVIAELEIKGNFVLSDLLAELPDVPVQLERVVPAGERTIPLIWIHAADPEPAEQTLRNHRLIASLTRLDTFEDRALYRIEWTEEPDSVFEQLRSRQAALLDAVGVGESWTFDLRFPTHEALSEFHSHCRDAGLPITVNRVYRPTDAESTARYGLSDVQYDTLLQALEQGHFNVPRAVTTAELGAQQGVSDQSITERIRRGLTNILTQIFVTADEESNSSPDDRFTES
jgi:predicted DNA binding protein